MIQFLVGLFLLVIALLPKSRFYEGRLGTKQVLPAIEPSWIPRLVIGGIGLAILLDGLQQIRHH